MSCAVCEGDGRYPVYNRHGSHLYNIECPECFGSGMTPEEAALAKQQREDRRRYEAAMAEMRAEQGVEWSNNDE